jgi:hypothetical protein
MATKRSLKKKTPAPQATAAPVAKPVAAPWWSRRVVMWALVALLALVTVEVVMLMRGKMERQQTLVSIGRFGERGGPPNAPGKFWGQLVVRADAVGRVLVVDHAFNKVVVWKAAEGTHLADLDAAAAQKETFGPRNADVDSQGNVYVLDKVNSEIVVFGPDLKLVRRFPVSQPGESCVSSQGDVYVVDAVQKVVVRYSAEGQERSRFGKRKLVEPRFLETDADGNVYVLDAGLKKIHVFNAQGKFKVSFGVKLESPVDYTVLVVHGKVVYVSQLRLNKIWAFSSSGQLKWEINQAPCEPFDIDDQGVWYMTGSQGVYQYQVEE